jgi:hypothetical protein
VTESVAMPLRDSRTASPVPSICPFLRYYGPDGLTFPFERPADGNVCVALDEPLAQSTRQQELVCLVEGHANCPRYLRGMVVPSAKPAGHGRRTLSPAVVASLLVLLASAIVSVGYVAAVGGLTLPPDMSSGLVAAASPTPAPPTAVPSTAGPGPTSSPVTAVPTPTSSEPPPSATPAATATPEPTPAPTPNRTPKPTPRPTAHPSPGPTSDRFSVLTPCPGQPDCWVYVVREGDNLYSIAHWFGVPLDAIYAMNPWARTETLRAGQELRIPTPTR